MMNKKSDSGWMDGGMSGWVDVWMMDGRWMNGQVDGGWWRRGWMMDGGWMDDGWRCGRMMFG